MRDELLAEILEAARHRGMTEHELARTSGVEQSNITRAKSGVGWLSRRSMDALAATVGLRLALVVAKADDSQTQDGE